MSKYLQALLAAILVLLGALLGWYKAYSDNDPTTKPDTQAVIDAGKGVYDAATAPKDEGMVGGEAATTMTVVPE